MQQQLFGAPATRGASRRSDPHTSRDAGRSMSGDVLRDQQALVLGALSWHEDATAFELWGDLWQRFLPGHPRGPKENVVARRLTELHEMGLIRLTGDTRPGSSSRRQQVWEITDKGREVLR